MTIYFRIPTVKLREPILNHTAGQDDRVLVDSLTAIHSFKRMGAKEVVCDSRNVAQLSKFPSIDIQSHTRQAGTLTQRKRSFLVGDSISARTRRPLPHIAG
jgi:hypothetical protein